MSLTLAEVQRIATEVAIRERPDLLVAVTRSEGESAYAELIVTLLGCAVEPCRILIGVDRDMTESQFRVAVRGRPASAPTGTPTGRCCGIAFPSRPFTDRSASTVVLGLPPCRLDSRARFFSPRRLHYRATLTAELARQPMCGETISGSPHSHPAGSTLIQEIALRDGRSA